MTTRFPCLNIEGGLFAADLIDQIGDGTVQGQKPADFKLSSRTYLTDEIAAAWTDARSFWTAFQHRLERLPQEDTATSITRDQWMIPLLSLLGYELTYTSRAAEVDGQTYAISHRAGPDENAPPVHIVGCRQSLDRRPESGRPRLAPHSLLQEYINRTEHLWGIATNGYTMRLLRDSQLIRRQAYIEFDLKQTMESEKFADFALLYRLVHRTRLPRGVEDASECLLERYHSITIEQGGRVRDHLRDGVEEALKILANGLLHHPKNQHLRERSKNGELNPYSSYQQLLRLIYRFLFLMVAEERNLITENQAYRDHYSISRLRYLSELRATYSDHEDLWIGLQTTFRLFQDEQLGKLLGVPPLNGDLFNTAQTPDLQGLSITNREFLTALWQLSMYRENERTPWRRINYAALDVEELGSVYESLLDFQPVFIERDGKPTFDLAYGMERKSTGSYYTRPELVQELIKSALVPVLEERLAEAKTQGEKEKALLSLKVCDPASGSGHFLLAAARRIAKELARIRTGEEQPTPTEFRIAVRDVIGHCIYGVDLNPLAVDLCKVALWIEGHNRGYPLTFLDHRIKCGNSLIGLDKLDRLKEGVTDDAFKPVTGDDKEVAKKIKAQNRSERRDRESGQIRLPFDMAMSLDSDLKNFADQARVIDSIIENSPDDVSRKQENYQKIRADQSWWKDWIAANIWTSAFFYPLTKLDDPAIPTCEKLMRFIENPKAAHGQLIGQVNALAIKHRFFHWPLEFPEVAETGGFDVLLGNPPWEKITSLEREFFIQFPEIVKEKRSNIRKQGIETLKDTHPDVYQSWVEQKYTDMKIGNFISSSGRFPLSAVGELNTYPIFVELAVKIQKQAGKTGMIIKTGMLSSPTWSDFTANLVESRRLEKVYDFRNWKGWFPAIGFHERFTLITLRSIDSKDKKISLGYYLDSVKEIDNSEKTFELNADDLIKLNPITKSLPTFQSKKDKDLLLSIYAKLPIISDQSLGWQIKYSRGIDLSTQSDLLKSKEELERDGFLLNAANIFIRGGLKYYPLIEGKFIHQYDHRFASFEGIPKSNRFGIKPGTYTPTEEQKKDPNYEILTRYWISEAALEADYEQRGLNNKWEICFRDTTNVISNMRTAVGCVAAGVAYNYKAPNIIIELDDISKKQKQIILLLALFNSIPFDYIVRQKFFGADFIKSILYQIAVPDYANVEKHYDFIWPKVLELSFTSYSLKQFAEDRGYSGEPFIWDEERRLVLRAEINAIFAKLYDFDKEDLIHILSGFPILKSKEEGKYEEYRTRRLVLEAWDKLAAT